MLQQTTNRTIPELKTGVETRHALSLHALSLQSTNNTLELYAFLQFQNVLTINYLKEKSVSLNPGRNRRLHFLV